MRKNEGAKVKADSRAEMFYNRMRGDIYMTAKRGKTIYDTHMYASGRACFNVFKSEGHSFIARPKGGQINVTQIAPI